MESSSPVPLPETTHPYAVRVSLQLGGNVELDLSADAACLPFAGTATLRITNEQTNPRELAAFIKRITVDLEAFSSASEADRAGKRLVVSLVWVAASKRVTIAFETWTGELPFAILDRTRPSGLTGRAEGRAYSVIKPEEFSSVAAEAFKLDKDFDPHILTSMEFYASARMESTERARFIGLMTALEALCKQDDYGEELGGLLDDLASRLRASPLLAGADKEKMRNSLSGRIKNLRRESVRRAIRRKMEEHNFNINMINFIDEAYEKRSKILHEGVSVRAPELHVLTDRVEDVMRQIYSRMLGLPLNQSPRPL